MESVGTSGDRARPKHHYTINPLDFRSESQSPLAIARDAVARGLSNLAQSPQPMLTQHALLIAWGEFATELGVIDKRRGMRARCQF